MATQSEACKHIFVNRRRFTELLDTGVIGRSDRDDYDLDVVRAEYIAHLRKQAQGRRSAKADMLNERKLEAEAATAELNLGKLRGSLVPWSVIEETDDRIASTIRTKLASVPTMSAAKIPDKSTASQRQGVVQKLINEALKALSGMAGTSERKRRKGPGEKTG